MRAGVQYKYPGLYSLLIPIIHRPAVLNEFRRQVGRKASVFDVAAGYGRMANWIDASNTYRGIDLNQAYINRARKNGLDVRSGDIFDAENYVASDVYILVDVVHHLSEEKLKPLFDIIFSKATKRVVIMEPAYVNLANRYGGLGKIIDWALRKLDNDGFNTIEKWFSEDEYRTLFRTSFSSERGQHFKLQVKKIYPYYIVTYTKP